MRFSSALFTTILFTSTTLAGPFIAHQSRDMASDDMDDSFDIFQNSAERYEGAICKDQITTSRFHNLKVPDHQSGCVRYFQGFDMTGVVTEIDLYFKTDGINSACDCIAACLNRIDICTNWVFKHTFSDLDSGKRSCTLYSTTNLPTAVNLGYNLTDSQNFEILQDQNNPQMGALAPYTFRDAANKVRDPFGVSGFLAQDMGGKIHC